MIKNIKIAIVSIIILVSSPFLKAQEELFTKTIITEKVIDIPNNFKLRVYNSSGNIKIKYWDKAQISCKTTVSVKGWTVEETEAFAKVLEPIFTLDSLKCNCLTIKYDIKHLKSHCNCKTGERSRVYRNWFSKIEVQEFSIDYEIFIPHTLRKLYIHNCRGNIEIPDVTGMLSINLQAGHLIAGKLNINQLSQIRLYKATAKIEKLSTDNSYINFNHCNSIQIDTLEKAKINSKYSNLFVKYCSYSKIESVSDKVNIEVVDDLYFKGGFSTLNIKSLLSAAKVDLNSSGKLQIEHTADDFENISFKGMYSSCSIKLPKDNYQLSTDLKNTDFVYPEKLLSKTLRLKAKYEGLIITENIGTIHESKINLNCSSCDIELK
jgi:hypothetical protein